MMHKEAQLWLSKIFSSDDLTPADLIRLSHEMSEAPELTAGFSFLYELAQYHSEAAFLFWQMNWQKKCKEWISKYLPVQDHIVVTQLFPLLPESEKTIFLSKGRAYGEAHLIKRERPLAFRFLEWREFKEESLSHVLFSYDAEELERLQKDELLFCAALVAGVKSKSYQLATSYANERIQGGRLIKDWSLIQGLLCELYLSIKQDEILVRHMTIESALSILKSCDQFASQNMQVLGGAGYTEDYVVERLFRECQFLKNWPKALKLQLLNHYTQEVHP
ncbi:MAG: acyl-CoA dehydrogenase family protein [Bacteriovorax sp.]